MPLRQVSSGQAEEPLMRKHGRKPSLSLSLTSSDADLHAHGALAALALLALTTPSWPSDSHSEHSAIADAPQSGLVFMFLLWLLHWRLLWLWLPCLITYMCVRACIHMFTSTYAHVTCPARARMPRALGTLIRKCGFDGMATRKGPRPLEAKRRRCQGRACARTARSPR